jgi:hypothetical protein
LVSSDRKFIDDTGTNTTIFLNFFSNNPPSFCIEIIAQSFLATDFEIAIKISCEVAGFDVSNISIQIWWNGISVASNKIVEIATGIFNISLSPILVNPEEEPILLNMSISVTLHSNKYFEMYIAVDPEIIEKDGVKPTEKFPLVTIIIAITSIAGGIGVAGVSLFLLRRRKRASEVK